jgi:hypothetical protein
MNTLAANELKRHGISAIEKLLSRGPVHVIKRNQPICVVLGEEEYARLTAVAKEEPPRYLSVMEWCALPALDSVEKDELDRRIAHERETWEQS